MTRKEAIAEQKPCEDCISRQAVIRLVEQYPDIMGNRCSGLIADIKHLPFVTPQTKTGHWKQISPARIYECDVCGQNVMTDNISAYRYCHGCGAEMVESEDKE